MDPISLNKKGNSEKIPISHSTSKVNTNKGKLNFQSLTDKKNNNLIRYADKTNDINDNKSTKISKLRE